MNSLRLSALSSTEFRMEVEAAVVSASDNDSGCALEEYTWVPPGLTPIQVHQYMATLPEALVPFVNSVGEQLRARRLLRQLPPHDHETRYCGQLSPAEQVELQTFSARRKRETLGRGYVRPLPAALTHTLCAECGVACRPGDLAVFVVPAHSSAVWHPACFTCGVCHELLVDLIYFQHAGRVFCGRHHAEQIKPRCAACDELIFAVECTRAEGVSWHVKHFCCSHCDKSLATQRYEMHAAAPYCCDCYDQLFGEACEACGEAIAFGGVSAGQRRWHDSPRCFRCYTCHEPLQADAFLCQRDALYCSRRCEGGQSLTAEESSPAQAPQPLPEAAADAQLGRGPQTESRPDAQLDSQTKDKSEAESRQDGFRLDGRSSLQQVPRCNSEAVVPAGRSAMRQPRLDPHHGPPSDEMLGPPVVNTAAGEQTAPSTVCCSASTNWPPDGSRRNNSSNPGRRHDGTDSGQHHDNVDSGQHHDNTDSGRRHDSADSGWHHDNTDSGRHHDNTDSGRQHDNVDSGRHHDNTNSGQCHDNTDRQRLSRQISENQPNSSAGRRGVPTSRSQTTLLDRSPLTQIDHQWHDNLSVRPSAVSSVAATNGTLSEGAAISPADYMLPPEQRVAVRSEAPQPVYADGHIVANGDIVCVLDERSGTMQAVSLPDSGAVRAVPPSDHLTRLWNKYRHRSSPASSASLTASSSAGHRDAGAGPAGRDRRRASGYISDPTSSGRRRAGRRASGYLSDPAGPAQLKASRLADDYGRSADRLVDDCFVSDSVMPERPSRQPNGYAPDSVRPAHVRENRRPSGYASDSVRPSHVRENRRPSGYASDSVRPSHVRENRRPSGYASDAVRPASRKTSGFVYDAAQQTYKAVGRCDRYNHDATRQGMAVNLPADRMKPITLHGQRYTSDVRVGSLSTVDNTGATHRHNAMAADFERCSTCSSSSDSEFDYYLDKPRVSYVSPESSLTAVNRPSYSLPAKPATQSFSKKKKKSKKCIVS